MLSRRVLLTMGLTLASAFPTGLAQRPQPQTAQAQADLEAISTAYTMYLSATFIRDSCVKRDPASAVRVNQSYAAWLAAQNLGTFEAQLGKKFGTDQVKALRQEISGQLAVLDTALQKLGPASQACPALATQFSSDTFDVRKKVPNLAALLTVGRGPSGTTAASGSGSSAGASVTVYSVAQLSSLMAQTVAPLRSAGTRAQEAAGLKKLQTLGKVIVVSGTTKRRRSITQADDRREVRYDVYCYDMHNDAADPPQGQVTVAGRIREFDASLGVVLEDCVVLSAGQSAQFKKSTLAVVDAAWQFKSQPYEKFLVPAGQGLKDSEILGAYMEQSSAVGVGGMTITTYPVSLFLKDGTVFNDPYRAPTSFNFKLSRQLEPQKWGKWTRQGNNFTIKWSDGRTDTFIVKGAPKALPAGTRLSGTFETISGGGTTSLGGDTIVVSSGTYTFRPDGTFTGGSFGGGGDSSVTVGSSRASGGTYSVSGYGITLRGSASQERRLFFARYNDDMLYIGSSTYTRDR